MSAVLFVGNSYLSFNNGIGWHLSRLRAGRQPASPVRTTSVSITGGGLDWHDLDSYFRPDAIGSYFYDENNNVGFRHGGPQFDIAVLMDSSQGPIHPSLRSRFEETVRRFCAIARRHGAQPVLLATWAYRNRPEMTDLLAEAYAAAATTNEARVVPVGRAFRQVLADRPDIVLHMSDNSHPSLAGTYLAACAVEATLFPGPEGTSAWTADLYPSTAHYLQSVARSVVGQAVPHRTGETSSEP